MACVDTTDTLWFRILALVTTGLVVGYSIANVIYFNRLRNAPNNGVITHGEATSMFIFSLIVLLLSAIVFIIILVRIFLGAHERAHVAGKLASVATSTGGIVTLGPAPSGRKVSVAPLASNAPGTSSVLVREAVVAASD